MNMPMPAPAPGQKTAPENKGQEMPGMKMDTGKKADAPSGKAGAKGKTIYTCEMHPEIQSDKPGNCPKCGMKLTPKK